MSFYIMSDDGQLIERQDECPSADDLRELAEECECDLWVIRGEHAGITYERPTKPTPKPRLVFGEPIPDELLPNHPFWQSHLALDNADEKAYNGFVE